MTRTSPLTRPLLFAALGAFVSFSPAAAQPSAKDVLKTYADIAQAGYTDSLVTAKTMQLAIEKLLAEPTEDNLIAARAAWVAARIPYMQTEAYRFGNAIVDDWEGKVNAWPLDEGLIDYVAESYGTDSPENELYAANVIANASLKIGGKTVDAAKITPDVPSESATEPSSTTPTPTALAATCAETSARLSATLRVGYGPLCNSARSHAGSATR